jgi:hypothetical protein
MDMTNLTDEQVAAYRRDGFIHLPGVLQQDEVERFRKAVLGAQETVRDNCEGAAFTQLLQLWRHDETLRGLTFHPQLAALAIRLAGIPLRLWHDQALIKPAHNGAATEFHQDQPFWPHGGSRHALSAWVALVDVPVERGCMTFIPGSQRLTGLRAQDLTDSKDLFRVAPELAWEPRVTIPLRAGDCTFHNAFVAHTANANATDDPRVAFVVIYADVDLTYTGTRSHVLTDPLDLTVGQPLPDEEFPRFPAER